MPAVGHPLKLAVSNIAWPPEELDEHLDFLASVGCDGVELAASLIWDEPKESSPSERSLLRRKVDQSGLAVVALHALLFARPDLQLFDEPSARRRTLRYLGSLCQLCADLGGSFLVFGSPRNRGRHGLSAAEAMQIATDFFRSLAEQAETHDVAVLIEPLSPEETDFVSSAQEGEALVRSVDHRHFGLHLDARALSETEADIATALETYVPLAQHFHVGDPGLAPPGSAGLDHAPIGAGLRRAGYTGYVSIEMRRGAGPSMKAIDASVKYVREAYGGSA